MGSDGWAVLGICVPIIVGLIGAWTKARSDGAGWKTSYQREKERSDIQDQNTRDAQQAIAIGNRTAEALHDLMQGKSLGGGQS